jgi:hypothetical protein
MKVLEIILNEGVGGYVWKYLTKETAEEIAMKHAVEQVSQQIFRQYTQKGIPVPKDWGMMVAPYAERAGWDAGQITKVKKEIREYYKELVDKAKKIKPDATDAAGAEIKKQAKKMGDAWEKLTAKGVWSTALYVWQWYDVQEAVTLYWEQMRWALQGLELGAEGKFPDGTPGFGLEAFHVHHKEFLGTLVVQLVATFPSLWNKVPVLGWASAIVSNKITNAGGANIGKALWLTFLDAERIGGEYSVRKYIDRLMVFKLNAIPLIGPFLFNDGVTIASVIGQPLVWTEDFIKAEWVKFLKATAYQKTDIPTWLLPDKYPNPNNPEDKKKHIDPNQNVKVTPAAADPNAETNPVNSTTPGALKQTNPNGEWDNMGNGFEVNMRTGHVRVRQYQ